MTIMIIGSLSLFILMSLFLWMRQQYKKKLMNVSDELKFFKKEKEYYGEAMMLLSDKYEIIYANQSAKDLFSLYKDNKIFIIGEKVELKLGMDKPIDFFEAIERKSSSAEDNFHFKDALIITAGRKKRAKIYLDKSGCNINHTITCLIDTDVSTENQKNQKDGKIDFLTGLPSQFLALSDINTLVMENQKKSESFALFLLGIDHFSEIQVSLGQNYTNQILKKMANFFIENPNENMKVYRMECNKFLLIFNHVVNDDLARDIARKLIIDIGNYYKGDSNTRLTVSVGIARYPTHGENATKLITHGYVALDKAQKESEANIELFSTEHQIIHKDEIKMNEEIRKGLKNSEFLLYYQPVFNLKTEEMVGAEALIRWEHPEYGIIAPDRFLEIAEKTGLIVDIGEYVFREAIKQRKKWDELGFKKFKITLNLSLREMQVDKLIEKLETLFNEYSVDPTDFNLDITEEAAMLNIEKATIDFNLFKDLGLSISLDHFGTSYSSLKYLQMLPLSMIKIDRSLIFDLSYNVDHQATVKAMILLAHTLDYEVVAEGVETSKESSLLYSFGCNYAQGYLFSRPLPVSEFQELLSS